MVSSLKYHQYPVPTNLRNGTERLIPQNTYFAELIKMSQNSFLACSKQDRAKIYPRKVTLVPLFCGKELNGTGSARFRNSLKLAITERLPSLLVESPDQLQLNFVPYQI